MLYAVVGRSHTDGRGPYTAYGPRDQELALWALDARTRAAEAPAPTTDAPADGRPIRSAELRSVVRRLRRAGGVRRD